MADADGEGDAGRDADAGTGSGGDPGVETVAGRPCPYCGASMRHVHCEYVCPAHGVVMDCSDTFFHR
ncbi:HVO_2523 family zinc finger protein [Candidatus Halobonum tyrrellensis]|uniref:Small CPxCG-related zinc finger protein n=1 Tax=Candidatus Halobonum tyrrellensis G22 TaxID=1324957 RepID=V4GUX6_9EURY|nr:HVO_2523 family zinc finger protein [Candidatus Halobonum tyrrellensis]ESP88936.1 hypothetical protein K933_06618 [Candidatus Halobonum tyrrellensis G22]